MMECVPALANARLFACIRSNRIANHGLPARMLEKKARKDVVRSTMPPVRRAGFRVLVLVVRHLCAGKIAVGN
jgi:hypothetical protein